MCERCYLRHPDTRAAAPRRSRHVKPPPPPARPEWVQFRMEEIAALSAGGLFIYVDRDQCAGLCPLCEGLLFVTFIGRTPAARYECDRGCDQADVVRALGQRERPSTDHEG